MELNLTISGIKKLSLTLLFVLLCFSPIQVFAEDWTWNSGAIQTSIPQYNPWSGPQVLGGLFFDSYSARWGYQKKAALNNPEITASYYARIFNSSKGRFVSEGDTVDVGDDLEFSSALNGVSWNGTGYALDTPIGYLIPNAESPGSMCTPQDEMSRYADVCLWTTHISFSANPAMVKVNHTGEATLSCNSDRTICKVISPGEIVTKFDVLDTYGKFYYQYSRTNYNNPGQCGLYGPNGCFPNDDPSVPGSDDPLTYCPVILGVGYVSGVLVATEYSVINPASCSPFQVNIPAQSRTITLIAIGPPPPANKPPNISIRHTPQNPFINGETRFYLTGTDPENDKVKYEIDWQDGGQVVPEGPETFLPLDSSSVDSGTELFTSKIYATAGGKKLWARAIDDKGADSGWEEYTLTVENPCGNGSIDIGEQCDGANLNGRSCPFGGTISCNATCDGFIDNCKTSPDPFCGDKVRNQASEQCDGTDFGGATCQSLGFQSGLLSCNPPSSANSCTINTSLCSICGDSKVEGLEECDKGPANSDSGSSVCSTSCKTRTPVPPPSTPKCVINGRCETYKGENPVNCPKDCPSTIIEPPLRSPTTFRETQAPKPSFMSFVLGALGFR